jgi:hypothetical protein
VSREDTRTTVLRDTTAVSLVLKLTVPAGAAGQTAAIAVLALQGPQGRLLTRGAARWR